MKNLTGKTFAKLTVTGPAFSLKSRTHYPVRCECGESFSVRGDSLIKGTSKSCGCLQREIASQSCRDLTGQRFGRLTVKAKSNNRGSNGSLFWGVTCDCGEKCEIRQDGLLSGVSQSCGCLQKDLMTNNVKHGKHETEIYSTWEGMIQRCTNPSAYGWKYYGGRGITVCERWRTFEHFYADMGDKPNGLTIDRIDNYKGYEKSNCRWATWAQQAANRRQRS